ncbi:hypothetical protein PIB30_089646, partial [Stylosanthes scabra]|nr:hypothetical protein [Stylosanthes scabra]
NPRICVHSYAYAWDSHPLHTLTPPSPTTHAYTPWPTHMHGTLPIMISYIPSSTMAIFSLTEPTHMRPTLRICVAIMSSFPSYSPVSTYMRATLRICVETSFPSLRLADYIGHVHA